MYGLPPLSLLAALLRIDPYDPDAEDVETLALLLTTRALHEEIRNNPTSNRRPSESRPLRLVRVPSDP